MEFQQTYYITIITVFGILAYVIYADANAAEYTVLMWKLFRLSTNRFVWWLKLYPRLRWDTYMLKRRGRQFLKNKQKQSQ